MKERSRSSGGPIGYRLARSGRRGRFSRKACGVILRLRRHGEEVVAAVVPWNLRTDRLEPGIGRRESYQDHSDELQPGGFGSHVAWRHRNVSTVLLWTLWGEVRAELPSNLQAMRYDAKRRQEVSCPKKGLAREASPAKVASVAESRRQQGWFGELSGM
jgi:hypothetical protein